MPCSREHAERQLVGEFLGAFALDFAHRRIRRRRGRNLGAGDEMAKLRELDQDVGGIGARLMERAHDLERRGDLTFHDALEQRDDLAPVREAQHVANGERRDARFAPVRDALVEQRQRVAH